MKNENEKKDLTDFAWDDTDFFADETTKVVETKDEDEVEVPSFENFGEEPEKDKPENKKKKVTDKLEDKSEDKSKDDLDKDKKKKEEKAPEFFVDDDSKTDKSKTDEKFFTVLAKGMKEKGVLGSIEIPEEDLEEDDFVKLYEEEIDNRISETFEGFFEELDDDAKAFLKHKKDGGNTSSFFNMLKDSSSIPKGDLDDIAYQKMISKHYLKVVENLDPEDIDDKITWLEETGKLEKYATKYDKKVKSLSEKQRKDVEIQRKNNIKQQDDNAKLFIKEIKDTLKESDTILKFNITKTDEKELTSYITEPQIKVGKNKYVTGLQDGLKKIMKDNEKLILLAKLIKSNFDISSIETKVNTEKTIEMKKKLVRAKKNVKSASSTGGRDKKLSDFFN